MFSTGKNFPKGLLIISLMMMVSITSCGEMLTTQPTIKMDVPPPQTAQLKTFKTSGEYLKAGKASFDAKQFDEAQAYLSESVRLDPKNQAAHLLLGVTYVKLGKGTEARREFDKAVQLDAKTGDAETAKSWLKRLNNPLGVGILPVKQSWFIKFIPELDDKVALERKAGRIDQFFSKFLPNIEQLYYRTLSKVLSDCGLYSTIDLYGAEPVEWDSETIHQGDMNRPIIHFYVRAINSAKLKGKTNVTNIISKNAKILIDGDIDLKIEEEGMLIGGSYSVLITSDIDLYSVKDARLIKNISDKIKVEKVGQRELKNYMDQAFKTLFQKMALEIHNALL
ncbi:MAG: tetratricopeptide repeat protein [Planctomycetes bacterium]|nr:tetratricopeptide repeat protein [Planctomycetota bacterium]MCG2771391.1 tetratricopeptide repeat protein [Desulfobacterales bacterium]